MTNRVVDMRTPHSERPPASGDGCKWRRPQVGARVADRVGREGSVIMIAERPPLLDIIGIAVTRAAVALDQSVRGWRSKQAVTT